MSDDYETSAEGSCDPSMPYHMRDTIRRASVTGARYLGDKTDIPCPSLMRYLSILI